MFRSRLSPALANSDPVASPRDKFQVQDDRVQTDEILLQHVFLPHYSSVFLLAWRVNEKQIIVHSVVLCSACSALVVSVIPITEHSRACTWEAVFHMEKRWTWRVLGMRGSPQRHRRPIVCTFYIHCASSVGPWILMIGFWNWLEMEYIFTPSAA